MRLFIPKEKLIQLYCDQCLSLTDIARMYGLDTSSIHAKMVKFGISRRGFKEAASTSNTIAKLIKKRFEVSKEELVYKYFILGMSKNDIAKEKNCSVRVINDRFDEYGLKCRTMQESLRMPIRTSKITKRLMGVFRYNLDEKELTSMYLIKGESASEIARHYKVSTYVVQQQLKKYGIKIRTLKESYFMSNRNNKISKLAKERLRNFKYEIDKNDLAYRYLTLKMTMNELANYYGYSNNNNIAIHRRLKKYGIKIRKDYMCWAFRRRPNKCEKYLFQLLNFIYPNEFEYVGDGRMKICNKNPDFVHTNGKKLIIELFGDYWHKGKKPNDRAKIFASDGYKTLVIWERELYKPQKLIKKIINFVEPDTN